MDARSEIKGQPMPTKLVELEDSILVEIEVPADEVHPIQAASLTRLQGHLIKLSLLL
jgi:hypothetical protein